jgi:hypothetical protein
MRQVAVDKCAPWLLAVGTVIAIDAISITAIATLASAPPAGHRGHAQPTKLIPHQAHSPSVSAKHDPVAVDALKMAPANFNRLGTFDDDCAAVGVRCVLAESLLAKLALSTKRKQW